MPDEPLHGAENFGECLSETDPCSEEMAVWSFVVAELDSPRWTQRLEPRLSRGLVEKLRLNDFSALNRDDLPFLRAALLAHRGSYVEPLLQATTRWARGELRAECLEFLRVIAEPDFVIRSTNRQLGQFAEGTERGVPSIPDFDEPYHVMKARFRRERMKGTPILVSPARSGPYTIAEGLTRLTLLTSLKRQGTAPVGTMPVIFGVNPAFSEWRWI